MAFEQPKTAPTRPSRPRPVQPKESRWGVSGSTRRMIITAVILFGLLFLLVFTSAFWVNWWWFGSMGYRSVLTTQYTAQALSFILGGLLAVLILGGNVVIALRRTRANRPLGTMARVSNRLLVGLVLLGLAAVFIVAGLWSVGRWRTWLLWFNGKDFGIEDPVFGRDAGFYIFALPALTELRTGLLFMLLAALAAVTVVYVVRLSVNMRRLSAVPATMRVHVFALGGLMLAVLALSYWLANFDLAYSTRGWAFGPGYTDVNVQRIANWSLAVVSLLAGAFLLLNAFVTRVRLLVGIVIVWGVLSLLLGVLLPTAVQRLLVEPSELTREREYIANNIDMTRQAYALNEADTQDFEGTEPITATDLAQHPAALDNIRLWDYRIIRTTYQQLQSFVPYYLFRDVDVDRYVIDGAPEQVLVAARELEPEGLPDNAQTWTNLRLVYTHGYGAVVSPVSGVDPSGLPTYYVKNVSDPPIGEGPLRIERPEIYFGEGQANWIITNTEQEEFSGLEGESTGTHYGGAGHGTITLDSYLRKVLVAAHLGERNVMLSGSLTDESRVHLHRTVSSRIQKVAPWLTLDPDPYLVIDQGRLFWIVDAYTATDRFPNATRTRGINYLRNSVKVVVDAYDGTTWFYRTSVPDPIADAWGEIFDDLLIPIDQAPPGIASHFRYPELLFDVQSEIFASYHVTNPTAFYNGEDRWSIPIEEVVTSPGRMEPYYITMRLPGQQEVDFTLIRPFIPGGRTDRQNMTAWMAGRNDATGALNLTVFRFPRQETVFGPRQIEGRINQDPDISAQIALWNQSGSRVIRGNMLVIPLEESVLYVQPLYLQATATEGALAELRRVIVASSDQVVMRPTLDAALEALTQGDAPVAGPLEGAPDGQAPPERPTSPVDASGQTVATLTADALATYERAEAALQAGDWATYGEEQARLEEILRALSELTGAAPAASPVPAATPERST